MYDLWIMAEVGSVPARAGARVLLVDDDGAVLAAIARILRGGGCTVTECESATAASELVVEGTFDVVVSDIDMPGLSGLDLLKLLREREVGVPLILMTGAPTLDSAMRAVELGAFKYLVKPSIPRSCARRSPRQPVREPASGPPRGPGARGPPPRPPPPRPRHRRWRSPASRAPQSRPGPYSRTATSFVACSARVA